MLHCMQEATANANLRLQQKLDEQIAAFDNEAQHLNNVVKRPSHHHI